MVICCILSVIRAGNPGFHSALMEVFKRPCRMIKLNLGRSGNAWVRAYKRLLPSMSNFHVWTSSHSVRWHCRIHHVMRVWTRCTTLINNNNYNIIITHHPHTPQYYRYCTSSMVGMFAAPALLARSRSSSSIISVGKGTFTATLPPVGGLPIRPADLIC